MTTVLVIAPHPDDETIGCGGSLLRHVSQGDETHWLIVTTMTGSPDFEPRNTDARADEIKRVAEQFGFVSTTQLGFPTARLDQVARSDLIEAIRSALQRIEPSIIYLPFPGDVHSDHFETYAAAIACTKWFRADYVNQVLCYETLSETDAGVGVVAQPFEPNWFVDITPWIDSKIAIAHTYKSELGDFPFPRSATAIRALAEVRGAGAGFHAAESFMLIRNRQR